MSHFTTVATKINNIQCLLKALEKLKLKYTHSEQGVEVRGWRGQKSTAEVSINMGKYDIGVVKNEDGTYGLQADWWGVETTVGKTEQEVVDESAASTPIRPWSSRAKRKGIESRSRTSPRTVRSSSMFQSGANPSGCGLATRSRTWRSEKSLKSPFLRREKCPSRSSAFPVSRASRKPSSSKMHSAARSRTAS